MILDIEIEGIEIPDHVKKNFLTDFLSRISDLNDTNVDNTICTSLATILCKKPTDFLGSYTRVTKNDLNKTCTMCFEEYKENEYKRTMKCGHVFHKKCIDKWLNKYNKTDCPNCRSNVFATVQTYTSSQILPQ